MDPAKHMTYFWALRAKHVDGIVMNSIAFLKRDDVRQMVESGVPTVLLNRPPAGLPFSTVLSDNVRGGSLAAEHLVALGHRRTAVLSGPRWQANLADRTAGFVNIMQATPGAAAPLVLRGPYNAAGGREMMLKLLDARNRITAVFATSDAIAFGAIRAAIEAGIRIPEALSLIGFDDVEMAAICHPPLTTVRQLRYELGAAAVEILIRRSETKNSLPEHRTFGVELVERQSCRPLRAKVRAR
jgi:LacI family transcriptional regulator